MKLSRISVGSWLSLVGVVHVATTPVFFGDSLRSIAEGGVLFSVEADPASAALRSSGFWYAATGLAVTALGRVSRRVELGSGVPPRELPATLISLGLLGVLLDPQSGFWVFLPLGVLARRRLRQARTSSPVHSESIHKITD